LESELQRKLNMLPKILTDERDIKIAHISFAFDNKKLIAALIKRGTLITKGAFDKLAIVNADINKMYIEDAEKL
jgi:hypothetical protein